MNPDLTFIATQQLIEELQRRLPTMILAGLSDEEEGKIGTFCWAGNYTTCIGLVYRMGDFLDEEGQGVPG